MSFKKRILVVEDQNGWMLTQLIEAHNGFELFLAVDGEQAILMFGRYKPDITILDIRLPKKNGLTVLEGIKLIDPAAYVIVLTAYGDAKTRELCAQAGASEFFTKPVSDFKSFYRRLASIAESKTETLTYTLEHGQQMLIKLHRRLGILEERRALLGFEAPPVLIMEIEDIGREIERWQGLVNK